MKKVLFNLTEDQYERLGRLAKAMGCSKSTALRRSLELYLLMKRWDEEDKKIIARDKNGVEELLVILD